MFDEATKLHLEGRLEEAEILYRKVLSLAPNHFDALHQLGLLMWEKEETSSALTLVKQAIALCPTEAKYHCSYGQILAACCDYSQATPSFKKALELKPDSVDSLFGLALCLKERGELDQAIEQYKKALQHDPNYADAYNNLGNALIEKRLFREATRVLERAVTLDPKSAEKWYNLGNALREEGQLSKAASAYRKAIQLSPEYLNAYINLGNLLKAHFSEVEESIQLFRYVLSRKPDDASLYRILGDALKACGRLDEALDCYKKAMELEPANILTHAAYIFTLHYHPDYDSAAILREAQKFEVVHAKPHEDEIPTYVHDRNPERRLRIGYLSPNFRDHCLSFFTIPFLSNHDHEHFEIFCYSDVEKPDALTEKIRGYADNWRDIYGLSDAQVAAKIRADKIDILVDLTMYMTDCRPLLFARKPAPLQVAYLAYPGTTGLSAIDYRLTDPYLDPSGEGDLFYAERSMRLPHSFWCYDPLTSEPFPSELPAYTNGFITFGCLNNFCKITEATLHLWAKCLSKVPRSHLILLCPKGEHRQAILDLFGTYGIESERIAFQESLPRRDYLETYRRIDICLDTLPYNGHTTSLDAFWMGVPVITRIGTTVVGRGGLSLLSNLNLRELAATTDRDFVEIATKLASDLPRLSSLRQTLRQRLEQSPLMDGVQFTRDLENCYRQMILNYSPYAK